MTTFAAFAALSGLALRAPAAEDTHVERGAKLYAGPDDAALRLVRRDAPRIGLVCRLAQRRGIGPEQAHVAQPGRHRIGAVGSQRTVDLRAHGAGGRGAAAVEGMLADGGGLRRRRHIIRRRFGSRASNQ